jgi:hypothetical protein
VEIPDIFVVFGVRLVSPNGIPVERSEWLAGNSKYSFAKLLGLAFDGVFAFSVMVLRAAAAPGIMTIGVLLIFAAYSIYIKSFLNQITSRVWL